MPRNIAVPQPVINRRRFRSDAAIDALLAMTADEVEVWIEEEITSISDVKEFLAVLAKITILAGQRL